VTFGLIASCIYTTFKIKEHKLGTEEFPTTEHESYQLITRKLSYRKDDRGMRPMWMGALKIFESP